MWNLDSLMRPMMMRIDQRNTKPIPLIFYAIALITTASYLYVYVFSMAWFVFWRCMEKNDINAALIAFSLGTVGDIGFCKTLILIYNLNSIRHVVHECLDIDSQVTPGSQFDKTLKGHMKVVKKRALVFWFVFVANAAVYAMMPVVLPGRRLMEDSFIFYGLEPMLESPNYEIAFCVNFTAIIFTSYVLANISAFLIITTGIIEAQMVALTEQLLNVFSEAEEYYRKDTYNDEIAEDHSINKLKEKKKILNRQIKDSLDTIVHIHTRNIYLLREIETITRGATALEFLLLIIGLIAQLLAGLEKTYLQTPYTLMVVAMDCLVGQRVTDAGEEFEIAVYDSKWEDFDVVNRKTIMLILQNAQKPMELSAGSIATLNFACFMTVLRFIYSTYTTMRSML